MRYDKENKILTIWIYGTLETADLDKVFLTSPIKRDYKPLIKYANHLHKENFNFEIIVTERDSSFNSNCISANISNNFIFNHNISYSEL